MASVELANFGTRRPWAGYLLGFALGGFFDGILLHQILQWHHLLLAIQSGPFQDMRTQILADGLFHVLMYVIALAGILSLWRSRQTSTASGERLFAEALIGFGAWHIIDAVLSHWLLGIHRIKMDSPNPLAWDLIWLAVFGIIPFVIGFMMRKRVDSGSSTKHHAVAAMLILAVFSGGIIGALPSANAQHVAVIVRPSQMTQLLNALATLNAGIVWADRSGALWVLRLEEGTDARNFYEHGAFYVTSTPAALGCLAWSRIADDS